MIPVLFEIGPLRVYSYGLMLGVAFLAGSAVLASELKRRRLDPGMASTITILGVVFGIAGAKFLYLIEEWDLFLADPLGMAFSPGGLTWYGGFLVAMLAVYIYIRRRKVPFLKLWDCLAPALILAYGIGRLGCHFSGDGDYGTPTTLPWGTIYAQGTAKPARMLEEYFFTHPEERVRWNFDSLRIIQAGTDRLGHPYSKFDEVTPLHPTPVYELLLGVAGYFILLWFRRRPLPDGAVFMIYLLLASVFRFAVEFWRLQPKILYGLSEAQIFATGLFVLGLAGLYLVFRRYPRDTATG